MNNASISSLQRLVYRSLMSVRPAPVAALLKKYLRVERRIIQTERGNFYIDPVSQFGITLLQDGVYEPHMIGCLEKLLKPTSVFVDVGANEGYFSVIASKIVGPTGRVIACEPQQRLEYILSENLRINSALNVKLLHSAISDATGEAVIYISPDTNTGSTSLMQTTKYKLPVEPVHTVTLSDMLSQCNLQTVDLLKMDIEGFEYEAILGSPEVFRTGVIRNIALELHPVHLKRRGLKTETITSFLKDCGYITDDTLSTLVFTLPH